MNNPVSLGIDLGTSELKAILLDEEGAVLGHAAAHLTVSRRQGGWSEQDPQDWWQACLAALAQLRQVQPDAYGRVRCIGLTGQMHGAVLLGDDNRVLYPAILWDDSRAMAQAERLGQDHGDFAEVTGSLPMAGLTAPKLLWLQQHEPQVFRAIDCVLSPKDYLRLCLSGERISDVSDAAGTLWLEVARRDWYEPMVRATGLEPRQMPRLVEGPAACAQLSPSAARQIGLAAGLVIAGGGGDNPVSAVGIGAVEAGDAFVTLGTSAAIVAITDHAAGNPTCAVHSFCHALPQRWYTMGAMLAGASCLRWVTRLLGFADEATLLRQIQLTLPVSQAVGLSTPLFLPYLAGERTPHNDPLLRGGFMGLGHDSGPAMLGYAVLEGVGFGLLDAMNAVCSAGATVQRCALVGGGARSEYWAQLLANILEREIVTLQGSELSAGIGAAKLGFLAMGQGTDLLQAGMPVKARYLPDPGLRTALQERYGKFQGLLSAAKTLHG
ncbi:xylulose kinase [Pseudomonas agarici]|uniref:Xylulose kinase n=1 Tax=Pseudomonas agarici TaxID=46677 RepID=A0A0X1SYP5_PSEAA|nr:xylulokinase [Pseudomonas agarici]AMB84944.1 xylulose kinase [Pseudomonas agarici]NWB93184.1 xylulokinase [Pseudomonas agarici]NWC08445.1 xylulokinase [Pseudomonas agarici]SEK67099.1 xylulokinase [Pseudomonas agarici]